MKTKKVKTGIKRNWFQILFGYDYVANLRTKEIHKVDSGCKCFKDFARHNQKYLTRNGMLRYMAKGYNGCRWCMTEFDKG
jgi:hypothetical protein